MKERNYNIDFLRGIAALWIIVIHTAFWSGETYLPVWFKNLTLLLDIPAFMYISGITYSFNESVAKSIKGIINQWKKWLYFLIFYVFVLFVFYRDTFTLSDVFHWLFYVFPNNTALDVVHGSIWFLTMYIRVSLLCSIIITLVNYFIKDSDKRREVLINIIILILLIFGYSSFSKTNFIFSTYTSFYSIMYLIGYLSRNFKIDLKKTFIYAIVNLCLLLIVFKVNNLTINNLQNIKFPPSFPYLFIAAFQIILFWYLKDKLKIKKSNVINYVGKNAIFYYFAQGVSSSLLFIILNYIKISNIYLTFIILLIINIILTSIIAIFLEKSYSFITHKVKLEKIKKYILPLQK